MKVMNHKKFPTPGEQTLNYKEHKHIKTPTSIYSKPDPQQQFRIILSKRSTQATLWNSLYCKAPKNSTLPTSLPQHSASCDPKNPKRNAQSFSHHSGSVAAPCHHFSHLTLTPQNPQSLHCAKNTQLWYIFLVYRIIISPPLPPVQKLQPEESW